MPSWSMKLSRELIELSKASLSGEAIAVRMNRKPETILKMAKRLGLSLKPDRKLKVKK
jgi:cell division protein FtsL